MTEFTKLAITSKTNSPRPHGAIGTLYSRLSRAVRDAPTLAANRSSWTLPAVKPARQQHHPANFRSARAPVRNSVAHGIEHNDVRRSAANPKS